VSLSPTDQFFVKKSKNDFSQNTILNETSILFNFINFSIFFILVNKSELLIFLIIEKLKISWSMFEKEYTKNLTKLKNRL